MKYALGFFITIAVFVLLILLVGLLDHVDFFLFVLPIISLGTGVSFVFNKDLRKTGIGVLAGTVVFYVFIFWLISVIARITC